MRHAHRTRTTVEYRHASHVPAIPNPTNREVAGLVVCVVILGTWAVSTQRWVRYTSVTRPVFEVFAFWGLIDLACGTPLGGQSGWDTGPAEFGIGLFLPMVWIEDGVFRVRVPFLLPLTLTAIPAAILWHRDRRTVKPGHCRQCGYDLRASKKTCPECGTAIPWEPSTT